MNREDVNRIRQHAMAIARACGAPCDDDAELYLSPAEAQLLLGMREATEPERRERFKYLRDKASNLRTRQIRGVAYVHLADWRPIAAAERRRQRDADAAYRGESVGNRSAFEPVEMGESENSGGE